MSSRSRPLPNIPVKHAAVRKVLNITPPLEVKLRAYIAYYATQQDLDAKQAPSEADTIVALIESFLDRDVEFNRYLRSMTGQKAGDALPRKAAPVSTI